MNHKRKRKSVAADQSKSAKRNLRYTATRKDFEEFEKTCVDTLKSLGLLEWTVKFNHKKVGADYQACVLIDYEGKVADFRLNASKNRLRQSVQSLAVHEVFHVLLARYGELASRRYVTEAELADEDERIVRLLEHAWREHHE